MESGTLLLELIAMLTLLTQGGNTMYARDFGCRWQTCNDRLLCGFDHMEARALWNTIQYHLTLDDAETVRCKRAVYSRTQFRCLYEGLRETTFGNNETHKFMLRLVTPKEVQTKEYNLTLEQMKVPEWNIESAQSDTNNHVACATQTPRPPQPVANGFYHDLVKKELTIYWQPLDVWEYTSKDLWYTVKASSGQMASVVGHDFAIFRGWNPEPVKVHIWSENSVGCSRESSHLNVPSNDIERQPRKVYYDDSIKSITWDQPIEEHRHIGYVLYWCPVSSTNWSKCDAWERMDSSSLGAHRNHFEFAKSMTQYHMALVANYSDGISGGLIWSIPAPSKGIMYLVAPVGSVTLGCIAVYALCCKVLKKLRGMMNIDVELPTFQPKIMEIGDLNHNETPIKGNISPEKIEAPSVVTGE